MFLVVPALLHVIPRKVALLVPALLHVIPRKVALLTVTHRAHTHAMSSPNLGCEPDTCLDRITKTMKDFTAQPPEFCTAVVLHLSDPHTPCPVFER
jgi:hypothetical protein